MEPAPVATLNGKVASGADRWKVTVRPWASTDFRVENRDEGPTSELIFLTRSKENFTSSAVTLPPPVKVRSLRSSHVYVTRPPLAKEQLLAASGTGETPPGSYVSSDWKTLLNRAQEPAS